MYRVLMCLGLWLAAQAACGQYVEGDTATHPRAAQPPSPRESFFDKLNFGGNFGASFGTYTYLEASPLVTYRATPRLQVGPGITYIYSSYPTSLGNLESSIYGGRLFARYLIFENAFAQAEYEGLNVQSFVLLQNGEIVKQRRWLYSPLVGGGYRAPLGQRGGGAYITLLYNLNYQSNYSPYPSPLIVRVGFSF